MSLLNTPAGVDNYMMPADAAAAKTALLALINGAATKIRLAMYTLTDPDLISAIINAYRAGLTNIMIALDFSEAHTSYEREAIAIMRATLTPARVVYTTSTVHNMIMHEKTCTIDDTYTITGSTNWTKEAWMEQNQLEVINNSTLAAMHSTAIDAMAAYGASHLPQT